ncbi:hypothetical protein Q4I28_007399 [Leishmania naiffi]|uniref:Uncharacterized protein n=1 Tax=Leishmania naiffi TaxID=5678 RepID=A0AAW3BA79_9TRYP
MSPQIVERLGGFSRCTTLLTFAIHFLHSLFSVVNFLSWVNTPESRLTHNMKIVYLSLTIVCCLSYFLGASVFYMWAWRFPEPEEVAKRRRVYGVSINLLFCDLPIFIIETKIVRQLNFPAAIMGFTYVLTCVSFSYSVLRVWFFFMVRFIKFHFPTAWSIGSSYPTQATVAVRREMDVRNYTGGGCAAGDDGGSVTPPLTAAGHTILLSRNSGLYSDDRASTTGLYHTLTPDLARSDIYYSPPSNHYHTPSSGDLSTPREQNQRRYRCGMGTRLYRPRSAAPPFRI